jgi:Fe-S cluster assembly protein SufD
MTELLKTNLLSQLASRNASSESLLRDLSSLSFPGRREEEWKYSIPTFQAAEYQLANPGSTPPELPAGLPEGALKLVFSAGKFMPEWSSEIPEGLELKAGFEITGVEPYAENFFSKLNEATASDTGIKLRIARNVHLQVPLILLHTNPGNASGQWMQPRISVELQENSSASISEVYLATDGSVLNLVNEIRLAPGADLRWLNFQDGESGSILINQSRVQLQKDAQFKHHVFSMSDGFVRNNLDVHIGGKAAHADLAGLSLGAGKSHCDHHSFIHHVVENTSSNQLYKGVYGGKSTGVFNGKILVDQEAQKTNAYQSGRNLLLSADARVFAKPQLEIFADDVKCSHGATIGQLDDEPLFYLRSRGLDLASARLLLVRAFASEILMQVEDEGLRQFAEERAIHRLDEITRSL